MSAQAGATITLRPPRLEHGGVGWTSLGLGRSRSFTIERNLPGHRQYGQRQISSARDRLQRLDLHAPHERGIENSEHIVLGQYSEQRRRSINGERLPFAQHQQTGYRVDVPTDQDNTGDR